ncbi:GGDEF domain-containing protein [Nocardia pseudobrasiliensis]|uniref:Diguanylate cyclase (GGDEF)-like protein n=1 Tax=Nocardia pseudobrasiliensis TaxID=45979 RepID=A0A370IDY4_9NOCA|nr:GGDEF domain-containing protein [Nocardia pseudobrasiliensis]RDI68932.1 diguanylate cyclase (GGDEF)-like protein [Nocardia pseudobrasiliensis]
MDYRELVRSWWHDGDRQHLLVKTIASHSALAAMRAVVCSGGAIGLAVTIAVALSAETSDRPAGHTIALLCVAVSAWWTVRWLFPPWPDKVESAVAIAVTDLFLGVLCLVSDSYLAKGAAVYLLVVAGIYCVFLHSAKVLAAHAAWSMACVIAAAIPHLAPGTMPMAVAAIVVAVIVNAVLLPGMQFNYWLLWTDLLSDGLTKLWSRRGLEFHAAAVIDRSGPEPVYAIMIDLDRFKDVNDRWGHVVGDEVLRSTADCLRLAAPPDAVIARIGGEEFAVFGRLPGTDAHTIAERMRRTIADSTVPVAVTASIGAAVFAIAAARQARPRRILEDLLQRADTAMYRAKQRGGDAVEMDHGRIAAG